MTNSFIIDTAEYKRVLEVIGILHKQREKALSDIESLRREREDAMKDPIHFVQRLKEKRVKLPIPQRVIPIPLVPFDKFLNNRAEQEAPPTREPEILSPPAPSPSPLLSPTSNDSFNFAFPSLPSGIIIKQEPSFSEPSDPTPSDAPVLPPSEDGSSIPTRSTEEPPKPNGKRAVIKTEVKTEGEKPKTFNQPWSAEEQKQLEDLLVKYPDEPVSSNRWKKIASHLPDRTPRQVASRTQKYFIKLAKMNLPVPGRKPNLETAAEKKRKKLEKASQPEQSKIQKTKGSSGKSKETQNAGYYAAPKVMMSDDDSEDEVEDEILKQLGPELKDTEEYQELVSLMRLEKLSQVKKPTERVVDKIETETPSTTSQQKVIRYKCDSCGVDPIVDGRWTCIECKEKGDSVDLCANCHNDGAFMREKHGLHKFKREGDSDTQSLFLDYNWEYRNGPAEDRYLTPSYFPTWVFMLAFCFGVPISFFPMRAEARNRKPAMPFDFSLHLSASTALNALGLVGSSYFLWANLSNSFFGVVPIMELVPSLSNLQKIQLWAKYYPVAMKHMSGITLPSTLCLAASAYLASTSERRILLSVSTFCAIAVVPWTIFVMMPTNKTMLHMADKGDEQKANAQGSILLKRWINFHKIRITSSIIANGAALYALLLTSNH
ncbi:ZZ-type zinc finger-containing protein 3 [Planoprotostelium fungivorum]|uniref:ZZ-type zinc finger-containing protein 3 n=1 Tax=Planoprotostelium fungivorum TaxID=1890364 RepID=A0A2P6NZ78_9EUKA|nr:ZZ-type zinc finger-containing protein 3 [Planoprotostelium fungivorum]